MTQPQAPLRYDFAGFRLDPRRRLLFGADGALISLKPKVFDTLLYFVEHAGELLDKRALMTAIWGDVIVEENSLNQHISALRRVLGENPGENRFVVTVPGRGYRFVAPVRTHTETPETLNESDSKRAPRRRTIFAVLSALAVVAFVVGYGYVTSPVFEGTASERTLAVLPFADLSETGDQAWLADGLTEEILNSLAALPDLRVTARTSSFQFKGENRDIGEIAKRLRVSYVVEGSVRRVGGRLRVTAQLVQARGGLHIWSNAYDATADDVLDVQRDVAEKIASALDIVLDENRREAMFRSGTRNVDAFEEFQKGWAIYQAVHNGEWDQTQWDANAHFERALNFDPGYTNAALAHADAFMHQLMSGSVGGVANSPYTPEEALVRLLADLDLAIGNSSSPSMRLANELTRELYSDTWYRLPGLIEKLRQEWDPSSISFEHAVWLRHILVFTGNDDLAREMAEEQLAIDPLGPEAWLARATVELHTGNFDLAREVVMQARRAIGDHVELERVAFRAAVLEGEKDEVIERLSARPGSENHPLLPAVRGDYETAARLADATDRKAQWPSLGLLNVYFEVGEADRAQDLVKRIDQSPAGSVRLLHHLAETGNALMFDLNHTPNFLAKMHQAGIDPAHFTPALRLSRLDTAVNE